LENKKKDGNDAFSCGKYQEAYDLYSECINLDPENGGLNSTLYNNRAAASLKMGKNAEAVADCTKAIDLDPNYLKAFLRRANCYTLLQQYEEAVRDYERAHQLDPEDQSISRSLRQAKLELKKSKRKDYYKILGISKSADEDEIKKAYRKLALKWHPDKNQETEESKKNAEVMFKDFGEAYAVLTDPNKKRRYDSGEDLEEMEGMGSEDINNIFSMFFGGGVPSGFSTHRGRGSSGFGGFPRGGFY